MRKTKIVATLGPSTDSSKSIKKLIKKGVNVFRLNFSHGTHDYHKNLIDLIRKVSSKLKTELAILQDISGPKIRICHLNNPIKLNVSDHLYLSKDNIDENQKQITLSYPGILDDVNMGESIFFSDGTIRTKVIAKSDSLVTCEVVVGGTLHSKKGINFPDSKLKISSITDKDKKDLIFGAKNDVDIVALSFVSSAQDVLKAKEILKKEKVNPLIISKIEKPEAINKIDSILKVSDGVMVARGDMGVELGVHKVPRYQKMIIQKANKMGRISITATQMLSSMISSPYPTRAEVSDIANAVLDGSDAVMLSDETTIGQYPLEAIDVLNKSIKEAERVYSYNNNHDVQYDESTAMATVTLSKTIHPKALVCFSRSGKSGMQLSKYRPKEDIILSSYDVNTLRKMQIVWGVNKFVKIPYTNNEIELLQEFLTIGLKEKTISKSNQYICILGFPYELEHKSNQIKILDPQTIDFILNEDSLKR